jgi:hypothetical protein
MGSVSIAHGVPLLACTLVMLSAACRSGPCQVAQETGSGVTGPVDVALDDGGRSNVGPPCGEFLDGGIESFPLYAGFTLSDSADAITLRYGLRGNDDLAHLFEIQVYELQSGSTVDLSQHGQVCIASTALNPQCCTSCQDEGPETCCPMTGTLTVRSVSSSGSDCSVPNECAQSIDATLVGASECMNMPLRFDFALEETGTFEQQMCPKE